MSAWVEDLVERYALQAGKKTVRKSEGVADRVSQCLTC
jgi:hypothetical protein